MANPNRPFGLKPIRTLSGASWNSNVGIYHVPATNPVAIFPGDPIILLGGGMATSFQGYPVGSLANAVLTTIPAGGYATLGYPNYLIGSMVAVEPVSRETPLYVPALTEALIHVTEDPMIVYRIQDNGFTALGVNAIGLNANLIAGAGSTTEPQSGYMLDAGTVTAPSTSLNLQLSILKGANSLDVGNYDQTQAFAVWEVIINWHPFGQAVIGI